MNKRINSHQKERYDNRYSSRHNNSYGRYNRSTAKAKNYTHGLFSPSIFAITLIVLVFMFIICANIVKVNAKKSPDADMKRQYVSIEIQPGDTLESIAREYYGPGYSNLKNYIKDIKEVNSMVSDTIYSGGYIIIPQYVLVSAN
ncbi:MAG: LysM peptidoglycan-binding domain-containing protein [Lachnospiraceae bacterium]|nr:LysM peptidoglycan-binding domain-containing protein [Lachnospiraceae bacterium]